METLKPHQEKDGWCGPSSLQLVARFHGIPTTQSQLAEMMGTTEKDGTGQYEMFCGAMKLGLHPTMMRDTTVEILRELQSDYHIIVDWMTGTDESEDGHYDVIKSITKDMVHLQKETMFIGDFNKKWYDVEANGQRVDRWAMIVKK